MSTFSKRSKSKHKSETMAKLRGLMHGQTWLGGKEWGEVSGKVREKILSNWGYADYFELSPVGMSYSQSYPQIFPRGLQRFVHESTGSTTTTIFIKIY